MSATLTLRPPGAVMRLARLGSLYPTRLSFMRSLLRRIARERWRLEREVLALDDRGLGHAVYAVHLPAGTVRLVAFSHDLAPEERSDRVIATRWDATFALTTAPPTAETLERLRANVPRQEAGRCSPAEYVLSRANRSVRLFDAVVEALAAGRQPDPAGAVEVGYLMRTTAVYGNGKYGLSDLEHTFAGGLFSRPFEAELLTVYLIRELTFDLVAHLARARAPGTAVELSPASRRMLGIGNATGLGMAPFLIGHPRLVHRWMLARETALARVRAEPRTSPGRLARFRVVLERAVRHLDEWRTADPRQGARLERLRSELPGFAARVAACEAALLEEPRPWARVLDEAARSLPVEGQELVNAVVLEPHGDLVDDLEDALGGDETLDLDPAMRAADLLRLVEERYAWALGVDYDAPDERHLFWYVSEEKLEPRLGERFAEPGAERELPLGIGREVSRLHERLAPFAAAAPDAPVAELLRRQPGVRRAVRRVQGLADLAYAEIRDNLLARGTVPVDLLRAKLATFGAIKFDPKSDRWTRITMYQGAPAFDDLDPGNADDWAFPVFLAATGEGGDRAA